MNPFERTFSSIKEAVEDKKPTIESDDATYHASVLEKIKAYRPVSRKNKPQEFSKRIVLGAQKDIQAAVCESTGIVYGIMMPSVQGSAMLVESPFASYKNCRGMASQGLSYLSKLNSQILAGVLITMAEHYSLFRYQPTDTGAQKNALLRTIERSVLIDAIVFIEEWVNTGNSLYIPKLSLILTPETLQSGMNGRMVEWLKTAVDAVYKPDRESYDDAVAVKRTISVPTVSKAKKEAAAVRKEFKEWRKEAKEDIAALYKDKLISFKLKSYLSAVLTEDNISAADPGTIDLLCAKMQDIEDAAAKALGDDIKYFHSKLAERVVIDWDDEPAFASRPVGSSLSEPKAETTTTSAPISTVPSIPTPAPKPSNEEKPVAKKSFMELLKERKAAEAKAKTQQGEQDAPF